MLWILISDTFSLFSAELQQCISKTVFAVAILRDAGEW